MQEKFQVFNRDELAGALRSRLTELEVYRATWHPEILSLLLQLSDRPAQLSKLESLPRSAAAAAEDVSLSWSDLNAQGAAYSNEDIWEEVDFAAESSEDDLLSISSGKPSPQILPDTPSGPAQDYVVPDDVFLSGEDEELIASIEKAQFWKTENHPAVSRDVEDASQVITELQLVRETIFMLQGLPTSIFWRLDNDIEVDRRYALAHSSSEALSSSLRAFTDIGTKLDTVRHFTQRPQTVPYMQTFCQGLEERLRDFDGVLSQVQGQYISAGSMVSLLQLLDDVRQRSRHLVLLSDLVSKLGPSSVDQPMRCLDLLYDSVCMLEALGDDEMSRDLAKLFFSCFKTFTLSIQLWMEAGKIDSQNSTFFVRANRQNRELRTLWHDWFVLDEGNRRQNIPRFLEPSAEKVFTTGKNRVFLSLLNTLSDLPERPEIFYTIFDEMFSATSSSLSLPFSALVESAFDRLVETNHSVSAGVLRTKFDEQCGLWSSLDALHYVYLGKDSSILGTIDTKVFELMDRGRSWTDRYLLTELTRSAFSAAPVIDPSKLVVRSADSLGNTRSRTVKVLEYISIDYVLPWSVANIVTQDAIHVYQRVSTFLMQIRRAKYAMVRQRLRDGRNMSPGDDDHTLVYGLHRSLLWFLDFLYSHLTYLVISTANQSLHSALSDAEDVDAMIAAHQSYMSSLEDECLLSESLAPIHEAIIDLLDLCIHFGDLQTARASENQSLEREHQDTRNSPPRRRNVSDPEYDSDDEDANPEHDLIHTVSFRDVSYGHQMRNVKRQSDHMINFIADGLKGVARAGGLSSWNVLADKLGWRKYWLKT